MGDNVMAASRVIESRQTQSKQHTNCHRCNFSDSNFEELIVRRLRIRLEFKLTTNIELCSSSAKVSSSLDSAHEFLGLVRFRACGVCGRLVSVTQQILRYFSSFPKAILITRCKRVARWCFSQCRKK